MRHKIFSKEAFKNKNIIISGGAGDIGLEIATEFANAGASKIALLDLHTEQLEQSLDIFKKENCEIRSNQSNYKSNKKEAPIDLIFVFYQVKSF